MKEREAAISFWAFCAPLLLGIAVFTVAPVIWGFVLSLSRAHGTLAPQRFVGLANYRHLLADPDFAKSLWTVGLFALFIVPVTYACSLGLALLVHRAPWGRGWFRTVFFLPTSVSYVVASLIWKTSLFSGMAYGLANRLLGTFGIAPILWVGTERPPWCWLVLVTVRLWLQVGMYMVVFLAALEEIPPSLLEAAEIDGAGGWSRFRHVTLPQLRDASAAILLLILIAAFQAFDEFYNILGGAESAGNQSLAMPPLVYLYHMALADSQYGRAAAGAFLLTGLILLVTYGHGRVFGLGREEKG